MLHDIANLLQDIPAGEEFDQEFPSVTETAHAEIPINLTEESADLVEEIEIEDLAVNFEDSINKEDVKQELLYDNARITLGESLLLTMAFIVRHKLSMVASDDLIALLELHCPQNNNTVKKKKMIWQ